MFLFKKLTVLGLSFFILEAALGGDISIKVSPPDSAASATIDTPENNISSFVIDSSFLLPPESEVLKEVSPVFTAEEYRKRLSAISATIPLVYNEFVQSYIGLYADRRKSQMGKVLGLADFYFPLFESTFLKYGVPPEMKYLAVVESSLNPMATSPVGAAGIWQFMYYTGKQYKLTINNLVDERRDPVASSDAAARYLKASFDKYGDWLLAIASYNCGPGNVNKAIAKAGGVYDFWAIRKYLPAETRSYVPAFIAVAYTMNYAFDHKIYPSYPTFAMEVDTVRFNKPVLLSEIAAATDLTIETLKIYNPHYKTNIIPASAEQTFNIVVPKLSVEDVVVYREDYYEALANGSLNTPTAILASSTEMVPKIISTRVKSSYVVRSGDNLSKVASKLGVKQSDIKKWNGMKSNTLRKGQKLKIYKKQNKKVYVAATIPNKINTSPTVASISNAEKQEQINEEKPATTELQASIGTDLSTSKAKIPVKKTAIPVKKIEKSVVAAKKTIKPTKTTASVTAKRTEPKPLTSAKTKTHKVQSGDTLWGIAQKYDGVTVESLKKANNIKQGSRLKAGQVLKIVRG